MEITTHLKNIGLIEDITAEFTEGNIYLVKGSNNKGKTTFLNSMLSGLTGNVIKGKLTNGKDSGLEEFLITGNDNKSYKVIVNHKPDKNPSFTIIYPNLKKSNKKSDLAAIFQYEGINTETFAGWGTTEPGRRKQAEMFMKLMPQEIQNRILTFDAEINTKQGTLYIDRRDKGIELKYLKSQANPEPTQEQIDIKGKVREWTDDVSKMQNKYEEIVADNSTIKLANQQLESDTQNLNAERDRIKSDMKALELRLSNVDDTIESLGTLQEYTTTNEELVKIRTDIESSNEAIFTAKEASSFIAKYNEFNSTILKAEANYSELTILLEKKRNDKAQMIKDNLNLSHISIDDGQLLYKDDKGEYPINEESLSYSRIAMIVADLTIKLNPNFNIVLLGKAAEFDKESKDKLLKFAQSTKSIIVLDKVENEGDLRINVYE